MEKDNSPKKKFPVFWIASASLLLGILLGSPLASTVIENNDGGEFWYRDGNPEVGPIVYNYGIVLVGYLIWIGVVAFVAFVALSTLVLIATTLRPK